MARVPKPLDREAWLAVRRPFFNASSAAVLFDRHPYQSPGDYAATKLTGKEQSQNSAMRRGIVLEQPVAEWWGEEQGYTLVEPDELFIHGRMMATVDRFITQLDRPVEIKTVGRIVEEPLPYWLDQCQAIMWCCGADTMDLVWLDASMDLQWQVVDGCEALQIEMADRAERFMAAIDLGMVPDWVTMTARNVATLHPDPVGSIEVDEPTLEWLRVYVNIKQQIREAEDELDRVKDQIANQIGAAEVGTFAGEQVVSWKKSAGHWTLDSAALKAEAPELFNKYRVWRDGSRRFMPTL